VWSRADPDAREIAFHMEARARPGCRTGMPRPAAFHRRLLPGPDDPTCTVIPRDRNMPKRILCATALVLAAASCANPKVQADIMSEVQRAADEINAQRQEMAMLQEQVDSLRGAIAKQDTVIKKLMNLAGIPGITN
jgi:hypothetical protein